MKPRTIRLFFLFTALVVTVCQCGSMVLHFSDGSGVVCKALDMNNDRYSCEIPCPSGTRTVMLNQWPDSSTQTHELASFCPDMPRPATATPTSSASPTPLPTETATSEPALEPTLATVAPLLSGDVTACDLRTGFINFKLVDGAASVRGDQVTVVIDGRQVTCTLPPNNASVLSCSLPAGVTFPAQVSLTLDDQVADQFRYDGAACAYSEPTKPAKDNSDDGNEPEPTPCVGDC